MHKHMFTLFMSNNFHNFIGAILNNNETVTYQLPSSPARQDSYTSVSQDAEVSFPPSLPVALELVLRACFSHASIHRHIIKLPSSPARQHWRQESYTSV